MSKFYPTKQIEDFHGSDGERLVYEALQKLPDSYTVFYSFRWLGTLSQHRTEGEADFIVLHPQKGILSIEVKAGEIRYDGGTWKQINRLTGEEKEIDPFGQAALSQYRIQVFLRQQKEDGKISEAPLMGRAVWFTSVKIPEKVSLPLEADRDILLDESSLFYPEAALEKAYEFWRKNWGYATPPAYSQSEFDNLVKLLMPSFHFSQTIASTNLTAEPTIVRLTRHQSAVLDFLEEQLNCAIHGPGGTGKTVLAVEKARRLAAEGRRVLYLCYNEFLLKYLSFVNQDCSVVFHNVRTLAEELMGRKYNNGAEQVLAFESWFESYDDTEWPYDDIVVDEGQDMTGAMLEHLWILADEREGAFYIFYDGEQSIIFRNLNGTGGMQNNIGIEDWIRNTMDCNVVLSRDVRNTSEIASSMASVIGMKQKDHYVNEVPGSRPKISFYRDPAGLNKICSNFVKDMLDNNIKLEEMVILSIHGISHSDLAGVKSLCGIPVSTEPEKGHVWLTNVYRFKGLEAKAVLLIDIEISKLPSAFTRRLVYTGGSRAVFYLKAAVKEDIAKDEYPFLLEQINIQGRSRKSLAAHWEMDVE